MGKGGEGWQNAAFEALFGHSARYLPFHQKPEVFYGERLMQERRAWHRGCAFQRMNHPHKKTLSGRIPLVLLWLVGVPIPILVLIFLFRGCS